MTCHGKNHTSGAGGTPALGKRGNCFTLRGDAAQIHRDFRRESFADQRRAASIYSYQHGQLTDALVAAQNRQCGPGCDASEEAEAIAQEISELPARGVTMCGWTQIAETDTLLMRQRRGDRSHAYLTGLQMCGLRWVCPVCTARKAMEDRQFVNDGLAAARGAGLFPVMVTMTTRHHGKEAAKDILAGIMRAEQKLKRLKCWTRLLTDAEGYARVLEWTHGSQGHHPHFHMILLLRASSEEEAIEKAETLRRAYMLQLSKAGRDGESEAAWKHSFHVQGAAAAEGYITKWGCAEEITGAQAKTGNINNRTPWQLLRLARIAPAKGKRSADQERQRFAAIWWEIICATKGKAQLYKSEGWKHLVEEWRSQQPEAEPEPGPEIVLDFGCREKRDSYTEAWLEARPKTLALREAAESSDDIEAARDAVRGVLRSGMTDDSIVEAMLHQGEPQIIESSEEECDDDSDREKEAATTARSSGRMVRSDAEGLSGSDRGAQSICSDPPRSHATSRSSTAFIARRDPAETERRRL